MSEASEKAPLGGLILAAGRSSRMGDFKPLLPIGGKSMLRCVLDMLRAAGAGPVCVVTGRQREDVMAHLAGEDIIFVHNARFAETQMLDSLCLGLRALKGRCARVMLCPVDVPLASAATARALLGQPGDFVRPVVDGRPGHPVVLSERAIPLVLGYDGPGGLGGAVTALGLSVTDIPVSDPGALMDADTPEDYRRLLKLEQGK
jgi:molybdenum cofactor cytidylyltransferase